MNEIKDLSNRPLPKDYESRLHSAIRLDKNENNDIEYLKIIYNNIINSMRMHNLSVYPEPKALYQKLSEFHNIPIENIFVSNGSDSIIRYIFELFGDYATFPNPTFAMYEIYAKMYSNNYKMLEYNQGFNFEISNSYFYDSTLFCLANPDSPTGAAMPPFLLENLIIEANKENCIVLIDEAYCPYHDYTAIDLIKNYDNLIVSRTFSKAYGLAGYRIGYCVANEKIISKLHKIKPMYEVSSIAVLAAIIALENNSEMIKSVSKCIRIKQDIIIKLLGDGFKIIPTNANFFHIDFGDKRETYIKELKTKFLFKEKFNHPCLKDYCRFSIGNEYQMDYLYACIKNIKERHCD